MIIEVIEELVLVMRGIIILDFDGGLKIDFVDFVN